MPVAARVIGSARPEVRQRGPAARDRVGFGGVAVDRVDLAGAIDRLGQLAGSPGLEQVVTVNLDFVSIARRDPEFRSTVNGASLAVADGMPLVWLSRLQGRPLPERITGGDLVEACCRRAAAAGQGIFLLGASPTTGLLAARRLQERFPGLRVEGYSPPFGEFSPEEDRRIVELINASGATYLFVAFGAPRQDLWIQAHREQLDVSVAIGVGCVLDVLAGAVSRAPIWMQRNGLEWLFRLIQEPGRLWRRYFVDDLPTLVRLAAPPLLKRLGACARQPGNPVVPG